MARAPVLLATVSLFLASAAQAQIVNVQARFAEKPEPGLHGGVVGGLDWRTGSNDYLVVRGGVTLQANFGNHLALALAEGEYGVSNQQTTLARSLEHLRYRYRFTDLISAETFAQHELNLFRRLELRALVGAGPRLHLVDAKVFGAVLGIAAMLEHERLSEGAYTDTGERTTDVRLSSYLLGRIQLAENLRLVETVYFQPRIDRFSDLRILNETTLTIAVNKWLSFSTSFLLYLDREPPQGVVPLDTQLRTSIGLTF